MLSQLNKLSILYLLCGVFALITAAQQVSDLKPTEIETLRLQKNEEETRNLNLRYEILQRQVQEGLNRLHAEHESLISDVKKNHQWGDDVSYDYDQKTDSYHWIKKPSPSPTPKN